MMMKIKFNLDREEVKTAIAAHVTQQTGILCHANHVHMPTYSYETPYVEIDTDEEQALASISAQQDLERALAIKEAA